MQRLVEVLPDGQVVEALAALMARLSGEAAWGRLPPPLEQPTDAVLETALAAYQEHWHGK